MQLQYPINLIGAYEEETGDVITQDGEVIGFWTLIDGAIYDFTPLGGERPVLSDPFVWSLCNRIQEWLAEQQD